MSITQEEIDEYFNNGNLYSFPTDNGLATNNNVISVKNTLLYEIEPETTSNLKFNQIIYDPTNGYDSNNYTFTISESGFYKYDINNVKPLIDAEVNILVNINDITYPIGSNVNMNNIVYLNPSDTFCIQTSYTSNVSVMLSNYPSFSMYRI